MKYVICSVYDRAAGAYGRPVFGLSLGAMIRGFEDEVNRDVPENTMFAHAKDFELFHLGFFDDDGGSFELKVPPLKVAFGGQLQLQLKAVV